MYISDNYDAYSAHEAEQNRLFRLDLRVQADEERADAELPWVDVPNDYGSHPECYPIRRDLDGKIL